MVLKLQAVAWSRHSIFMSRQRFPCRDRDGHDKRSGIATGLALGRDFMLQQSFLCLDRVWSRTEVSMSRQSIFVRVFQVAIEFGQDREFLCRDRVFFFVAIEFGQDKSFYVATKYFYVATELAKVKRIYVATEYFCVAT